MQIQRFFHRLRDGFQQGKLLGNHHAPRTALGPTYAWLLAFLFVVSTAVGVLQPLFPAHAYALDDAARDVLPKPTQEYGKFMQYNAEKAAYLFNAGYTGSASDDALGSGGTPRITATFPQNAAVGITATDPINSLDLVMKPQFAVGKASKSDNQIFYPLLNERGALVYTGQVDSVKEDILLASYSADRMSFDFDLALPDGLQARVETNGTIGIYGSSLPINGQVATGTDQDKALLEAARKNAKKDKLLFSIPAPIAVESNKQRSQVKLRYELDGTQLRIVAEHLKGASFPLAIDPSVYIETAQKLMRGNNETNVDFNTTNELIQKGELTGGRFDNWLNGMSLPANRMNMGTAVAGGYIYVVGGMQSNTRVNTVYWAKLSTTDNSITTAQPGTGTNPGTDATGTCTSWCTNSAYNLPVALSGMSLVAYNGFLYVIGGETSSGISNAVYIAKLGANGEPSLWYPGAQDTDTDKSTWTYWYQAGNLSTERAYAGAAAYNNRLYLVGGKTTAASGGVTTVEYANMNPTGTLSAWTSTGMVALPSARRSHNIQIYNDRMYLIGGISGTAVQSSIQYIKLSSDGTMAGSSWSTAIPMLKSRFSDGGTFSTIWGGYLYVAGGCSALSGAGTCSVAGLSAAQDIELASINADGSVTNWTAVTGLNSARTSYGLVSWRQTIYGIGGCVVTSDTLTTCNTDTNLDSYGVINEAGDVSTTNSSSPSGTAPCSGTSPTNCDIPPAGDTVGMGGQMADGVALNNGYIYLIGGCTDVATTANCFNHNKGMMSGNISYAALAVDGTIVKVSNCPSGVFYGTWCSDATNRINGTTGLGAMATTVFNNTLYVVGGTDGASWSANVWRVGLNADGTLTGLWTSQAFSSINLGTARGFSYAYSRANPASAGTDPGVMFVLGGCNNGTKSNGIPCTIYFNQVYKCYITTSGAIDTINQCTTTGQLQLDSENDGTGQGLAGMAGTVYAGYMYLIAGTSPNQTTRGTVMYAKIDDNNNIVAAPGGNNKWITSPNQISPPRLRGAAFGYNGYLYSLAGYSGGTSLNDVLYAKINVNDGSIGTFKTSHVTVNPRWGLMAVVANGFVYAMGGCSAGAAPTSCTALTGAVQTFQLYNNYSGTPAGYTGTNTLGVDRIGGSATVLNGYVYYAGGCSDMACATPQTTVYYAPLNADGTIGTWTASPNALPAARTWGKLVSQGGYLYYLGGQDGSGTAQSAVYYSQPSSGVPGAWGTATNGLPVALTEIGAAVWNNRLYVTGGSSGGTRQASVYFSPSLPSGGDIGSAWTNTTPFNIARSGHTTITYANNIYVIGGYTGSNYLADVQYAQVNSDGTVGSWSYTTSLPQYVYQGDGFAANGYMYLFGGRSASSTCSSSAFVSAISANTTIASGNNPTGVGDWSQTNVKFNAPRYGAAVAYGDGRAYLLGGGCTSFVAAGDRAYATALQSQPAVAKYSRMIDTGTDVTPTKWLMNGLDNDIGARWALRYRSSTSATEAWGQDTVFGIVTLGTPGTYTPLDGSGANTNVARYYYLSVSVDSSKAFGYPDDVTRGPTVDDITLFFISDPSKRLRHGKTFTGGQLQPLDTPF